MEIDSEGVFMLNNGAETMYTLKFPTYEARDTSSGAGIYVSQTQYYEGFSKVIATAKAEIYRRTQKFSPTYMVVGTNVSTILPFVRGWSPVSTTTYNGPYYAGSLEGLKVFVSPSINANRYFFGVNGSDLRTSAAVYAPYMSLVPTQLLGFADGTMTQGLTKVA